MNLNPESRVDWHIYPGDLQQFQLVKRKNQCCGECVATKCSHNRKLYAIGAIWKSDDHCTYFECTQVDKGHPDDGVKVAEISKYSKACPALGECPSNRITMRDCCQVCAVQPQANDESAKLNFVHPVEKYKVAFAHGTYRNHPCNRQCRQGRPSLTCFYKFIVSENGRLSYRHLSSMAHNISLS